MTTGPAIDGGEGTVQAMPATRIWRLQYGPCWCHSAPSDTSAFDYVRLRRTSADLGAFQENLLIVSERVIEGAAKTYREVHSSVPEPKLVISAGTCPTAHRFWDELPTGWAPVEEVLPVDIRVEGCVSGNPEALVAALLEHVFAKRAPESNGDPTKEQGDLARPTALTAGALEPSDA